MKMNQTNRHFKELFHEKQLTKEEMKAVDKPYTSHHRNEDGTVTLKYHYLGNGVYKFPTEEGGWEHRRFNQIISEAEALKIIKEKK